MAWPQPRQSDSLPTVTDDGALEAALSHLAAARHWRPDHYYAHRLAGQIYLARGDWQKAAEALTEAGKLAPRQPLVAWERGLAYEQMLAIVDGAPNQSILQTMATGQAWVPERVINTPFCQEGKVASCYLAVTAFVQPYVGLTGAYPVPAPVLLLHPPAQLEQTVLVPTELPGLRFMLGLDPAVHSAGSDGAIFRMWVGSPQGELHLVYERTVDGVTASQGWVPDWVDFSAWAGQRVRLRVGSDPGPAGDSSADWYGWGDLLFTTRDAARYAAQAPLGHMAQAWQEAPFTAGDFMAQARRAQHADEAAIWMLRAGRMAQ